MYSIYADLFEILLLLYDERKVSNEFSFGKISLYSLARGSNNQTMKTDLETKNNFSSQNHTDPKILYR
jgi:hypothetical protein